MWSNALYRSLYGCDFHIGVGSDVVCSTLIGSWKSLSSWNRQQDDSTLFLCQVQYAKSLAECHHDMETYTATSDVKRNESVCHDAPCGGLASSVLPEASCHAKMESSQTGVVNGEKMYKLVHELSCLKVQY